jgi:lipoate-protein ligase A
MSTLHVCIESKVSAAQALSRAGALAEAVSFAGEHSIGPAALYAAELAGSCSVLGAHQHVRHALRAKAEPGADAGQHEVVRRSTGGAALSGGDGVLYASLALRDANALVMCPPGKLLNRYVRGALAGLRELGYAAHYFGRDFVSLDARPVAYVAWAEHRSGLVQLELFIAHSQPFALPEALNAYPSPSDPAFRGRVPTTLAEGKPDGPPAAASVLEAIASGYARTFGAEQRPIGLDLKQHERAAHIEPVVRMIDERPGLAWSKPHEEAIGFVSAGLALDERGVISSARIAGDFFMHADCNGDLEEALVGKPPTDETFATAIDAVLAHRVGLIEGVRSLRTLHAAFLEAAQLAQA